MSDTLPLLTFSAAPHDEIRLFAKRTIDVMLAAAALVLLLPFVAPDRSPDPGDFARSCYLQA